MHVAVSLRWGDAVAVPPLTRNDALVLAMPMPRINRELFGLYAQSDVDWIERAAVYRRGGFTAPEIDRVRAGRGGLWPSRWERLRARIESTRTGP